MIEIFIFPQKLSHIDDLNLFFWFLPIIIRQIHHACFHKLSTYVNKLWIKNQNNRPCRNKLLGHQWQRHKRSFWGYQRRLSFWCQWLHWRYRCSGSYRCKRNWRHYWRNWCDRTSRRSLCYYFRWSVNDRCRPFNTYCRNQPRLYSRTGNYYCYWRKQLYDCNH